MATLGLSKVFILDKYFTELQKFWETEKKLQGEYSGEIQELVHISRTRPKHSPQPGGLSWSKTKLKLWHRTVMIHTQRIDETIISKSLRLWDRLVESTLGRDARVGFACESVSRRNV